MKPREAVTIAAWIRLDSNKGRHSIFDTVGSHSQHQNGQYHFEVEDGKLRWFHRNEFADKIFNAETGMGRITGRRTISENNTFPDMLSVHI